MKIKKDNFQDKLIGLFGYDMFDIALVLYENLLYMIIWEN